MENQETNIKKVWQLVYLTRLLIIKSKQIAYALRNQSLSCEVSAMKEELDLIRTEIKIITDSR
jgi:hypothetical protein